MEEVPASVPPPAPRCSISAEELWDPFVSRERSDRVVLLLSSSGLCSPPASSWAVALRTGQGGVADAATRVPTRGCRSHRSRGAVHLTNRGLQRGMNHGSIDFAE